MFPLFFHFDQQPKKTPKSSPAILVLPQEFSCVWSRGLHPPIILKNQPSNFSDQSNTLVTYYQHPEGKWSWKICTPSVFQTSTLYEFNDILLLLNWLIYFCWQYFFFFWPLLKYFQIFPIQRNTRILPKLASWSGPRWEEMYGKPTPA